jgi:predicted transcriptional regulator
MINLSVLSPEATFIVPGLNHAGLTQPSDANRAKLVSEATLDTALASGAHKAGDRVHLTMNDKLFAARIAIQGEIQPR